MALPEFDLGGKVAIVTGAGRGIGKAVALCLAEAGADIVAVARTASEIEQTSKEVQQLGRRALAIPTDVTKAEEVEGMVEKAVAEFKRIDILVNQAGGQGGGPLVPLPGYRGFWTQGDISAPMSQEEWQRVIDTNLGSVFLCCRAVGPHMIGQGKGKIISITSYAGGKGLPYLIPYTTTKAAVSMFTRSLALEWARYKINVNAIGPGYTPTAFTAALLGEPKRREELLQSIPIKRLAEPREIGLLAVYLASPASDYVTGQTIYIEGGLLA